MDAGEYHVRMVRKPTKSGTRTQQPLNLDEETEFLNVDLDIRSRGNLQPLVSAFGKNVFVLHVGGEGRDYCAHLEYAGRKFCGKDANWLIRHLIGLVQRLPQPARRRWDQARSREFNIGIQAGFKPRVYELQLAPRTMDLLHSVKGRVVLTLYAPDTSKVKR